MNLRLVQNTSKYNKAKEINNNLKYVPYQWR